MQLLASVLSESLCTKLGYAILVDVPRRDNRHVSALLDRVKPWMSLSITCDPGAEECYILSGARSISCILKGGAELAVCLRLILLTHVVSQNYDDTMDTLSRKRYSTP